MLPNAPSPVVGCADRLLLKADADRCLPGLQGDKVKFTLQFRGREMQYKEDGQQMLQVIAACMCNRTIPVRGGAGHDC